MSTFTSSQVAAVIATTILTLLPTVQFSGMMQPVSTLEGGARLVGSLWPSTYYMHLSVGAFTKVLGFPELWTDLVILAAFIPVLTSELAPHEAGALAMDRLYNILARDQGTARPAPRHGDRRNAHLLLHGQCLHESDGHPSDVHNASIGLVDEDRSPSPGRSPRRSIRRISRHRSASRPTPLIRATRDDSRPGAEHPATLRGRCHGRAPARLLGHHVPVSRHYVSFAQAILYRGRLRHRVARACPRGRPWPGLLPRQPFQSVSALDDQEDIMEDRTMQIRRILAPTDFLRTFQTGHRLCVRVGPGHPGRRSSCSMSSRSCRPMSKQQRHRDVPASPHLRPF